MSQVAVLPTSAVWPRVPSGFSERNTMFRVRFAPRGESTITPLRSAVASCAKSSGLESVIDAPSIAAMVTLASRRGAGGGGAVSGVRGSSPTCQPEGELASVTVLDPDAMPPADSTHAVLLQPTLVCWPKLTRPFPH